MGDGANGNDASAKLSKQVFWQSIQYVGSFYLTYTFPTTLRLLQTLGKPVPYAIFVLMATFIPMQGFFNATVYFGPRIRRRFGRRTQGASAWSGSKSRASASGYEETKSPNESAAFSNQEENARPVTSKNANEFDEITESTPKEAAAEQNAPPPPQSSAKRVDWSAEVMEYSENEK